MLKSFSLKIDAINRWIGAQISWLNLILIFVICIDVLLRYIFSNTKTWIIELEWHLFGLVFLLGGAYTLLYDKHVRVDLFYNKFKPKTKAWINLIGMILFLAPWCFVVVKTSFNYGLNSLSYLEGSPNPNGLPARFIIKFTITIGFLLLILQGLSEAAKSLRIIRHKD